MKSTKTIKTAGMVLISSIFIWGVTAPDPVQAAVAHARASAEVLNPAAIDSSQILADAAPESPAKTSETAVARQPIQPEVKIVTAEGVTWLSIDYN